MLYAFIHQQQQEKADSLCIIYTVGGLIKDNSGNLVCINLLNITAKNIIFQFHYSIYLWLLYFSSPIHLNIYKLVFNELVTSFRKVNQDDALFQVVMPFVQKILILKSFSST